MDKWLRCRGGHVVRWDEARYARANRPEEIEVPMPSLLCNRRGCEHEICEPLKNVRQQSDPDTDRTHFRFMRGEKVAGREESDHGVVEEGYVAAGTSSTRIVWYEVRRDRDEAPFIAEEQVLRKVKI